MLLRLSPAPLSRKHFVMFVAEGDVSNKTRQRYVGLAQVAIFDVFVGIGSYYYNISPICVSVSKAQDSF